jgi:hypothetical protein
MKSTTVTNNNPKFRNKDNSLTAYSFACGYVQWESKDGTELGKWENGKELYMEHSHFHVKQFKNGNRITWEVFDKLGEARTFYNKIKI